MSFENLAIDLRDREKPIALIFAFNSTGKTRLSVAYKNVTKDEETGKHTGIYYNAFSEDLFVWDNDEDNGGANMSLRIVPSSLSRFHSFLYENEDAVASKLARYDPRFRFRFNAHEDLEDGIESVTFFIEGADETPVKISRGEERIFVWCFYLALMEVDGWADQQNAHIFIDDPVSSLDEHNIFVTADSVFDLVERFWEKKRLIITTHHIGLYSILADRLTKGEKSGRYKEQTALLVLKRRGDELVLEREKKSVFLYHLHLVQVLDEARSGQLYTYHFTLLRQLLETIASFLGVGRPSFALQRIGIENVDEVMVIINSHSHKRFYYAQTEAMNEFDENLFNKIFERLIDEFQFHTGKA
jgi:hypothetical protein